MEHVDYMNSKQEGFVYKSVVVYTTVNKTLPSTKDRNPKGTPPYILSCIY